MSGTCDCGDDLGSVVDGGQCLADAALEVRSALEIDEYTDVHHDGAVVPNTLILSPGLRIENVYVGPTLPEVGEEASVLSSCGSRKLCMDKRALAGVRWTAGYLDGRLEVSRMVYALPDARMCAAHHRWCCSARRWQPLRRRGDVAGRVR